MLFSHKIGVGTVRLSQYAKQLVNEAMDNNRLSYGPMLKRFESDFAYYHGSKHCVSSNSGTDALRIALNAMKIMHGWDDGDEIIVPTITFVATINIVLQNNLVPVFVDVDSKTYNMDTNLITKAITSKTRAIIPVSMFGLPADLITIQEICRNNNLKMLVDNCECMGATIHGTRLGEVGDISCYSTFSAHYFTTGVGGLALTNNVGYATLMRSLVNHGRDNIYIAPDDDQNGNLKEIVGKRFNFEHVGYSSRITELEGALGIAGLKELPDIIKTRQINAARLIDGLHGLPLQLPYIPEGYTHSFMMFPMVITDDTPRDALEIYLEEHGIETRRMNNITGQPVYRKMFGYDLEKKYPVAQWINKNGLYIPTHQDLTNKDIDYIISTIHKFFDSGFAIKKINS